MEFQGAMLVVRDLEKTKKFYKEVLNQKITLDFGENVTFSDGFSVQTEESWMNFIAKSSTELHYRGNTSELYFEESSFDDFILHLKSFSSITYVHDVITYNWGQRVIRFYDPDHHMIEVGEDMKVVIKRFLNQGFSLEEVKEKTMFPIPFIQECQKELKN